MSVQIDSIRNGAASMSAYERQVWGELNRHWLRRDNRRGMPNWANSAITNSSEFAGRAGEWVSAKVPEAVKKPVRDAGDAIATKAAQPVIRSAAALLELFNDWALELNNPTSVEKLARKRGLELTSFADLRMQDLKVCDRFLTSNTLRWRTVGALEGGGMGVLALVPVAGIPIAIGADMLVIQVMSVSIASRIAYSYGFDAKDPAEQAFIQRLVLRSFTAQAAKAKPLRDTARAAHAIRDRVRWSSKLRTDHRILAALEKLLKQMGPAGTRVSTQSAAKFVPLVGILVGAGMNSAILGNVARDAQRYCQTRFLCEKYDLPLPTALKTSWTDDIEGETA